MTQSKEEVVEAFRVQTIRDAAIRVIARKGMSGASMQEIADEAGISKGTIYLYFRNQQELLEASVDESLDRLLETLTGALEAPGTFEERFRLLLRAHLEFFQSHADLFHIYRSSKLSGEPASHHAHCDRASRPQYQQYMGRLVAFLEEAMKKREIRKLDASRLAIFLQEGIVAVTVQRVGEQTPSPLEGEVDWLVQMVLQGIGKQRRSLCEKFSAYGSGRNAAALPLAALAQSGAEEAPAPVTFTLQQALQRALEAKHQRPALRDRCRRCRAAEKPAPLVGPSSPRSRRQHHVQRPDRDVRIG